MKLRNIVWTIILILVIIFAVGNRDTTNLWFFRNFESPKIVAILICFVVGFFAGFFSRGKKK
ncbi:MAG: hypothetical protein U9N06_00870 [candidate division WOR-3 bacterium]|nr:hypothetical protein [candidate division WOR-3 bacterium]